VTEPIFWLGLSFLLVAVSLTAVIVVAIPVLQELARAARSAEKLFDTLRQELPPTLEAIRLTGLEVSDLTDEVSEGVQRASNVAKQVDQGVEDAKQQVQAVNTTTRSIFTGVKAAWKTFSKKPGSQYSGQEAYQPRLSPNEQMVDLPQPNRESQRAPHRQYSPTDSWEQAALDKTLLEKPTTPELASEDASSFE